MILVFGTVCLDKVRRVPELPKPGGYVEVLSESLFLGGEAANTANALESWGDELLLVGNPLGTSAEAEDLRGMLSKAGLKTMELLAEQSAPDLVSTPVCDIYVSDFGERTMFGRGFSALEDNMALTHVPWTKGSWFTAEPNIAKLSRSAAVRAAESGMQVYLMDFVQADDPILPGSFWQSSTDWAGFRNNTQKNVQWVKNWVAQKGCFVVLSDGPNGFVAGAPDMPVRAYPPFPAPEVVDTTGAGDLFRAGMLHGLSRNWTLADCLRFASAAGCLKCRSLGATADVPSILEIERHISENPDVAKLYG